MAQPEKDPLIFGPIDATAFRARLLESRPCRMCKADIHMMRTANDARMPVNAFPIKISKKAALEQSARKRMLFSAGGVIREHLAGEVGFMPHWATCPHAGAFKKKAGIKSEPISHEALLERLRPRMVYLEGALKKLKASATSAQRKAVLHELHAYAKRTLQMMEESE